MYVFVIFCGSLLAWPTVRFDYRLLYFSKYDQVNKTNQFLKKMCHLLCKVTTGSKQSYQVYLVSKIKKKLPHKCLKYVSSMT